MAYFGFFCTTSSSSTAGREARIQTGALPAVGWSSLGVPSMGTVLMGFKSLGCKPEIMKMNTKIPAEVKEVRVIGALKEDDAKPACR